MDKRILCREGTHTFCGGGAGLATVIIKYEQRIFHRRGIRGIQKINFSTFTL